MSQNFLSDNGLKYYHNTVEKDTFFISERYLYGDITDLLDDALASGFKKIVFPCGTFQYTGPAEIPGGVSVIGQGIGKTILQVELSESTEANIFEISGDYSTFRDFSIEILSSTPRGFHNLFYSCGMYTTFKNIAITEQTNSCFPKRVFFTEGANDMILENISYRRNSASTAYISSGWGFYLSGDRVKIKNCKIDGAGCGLYANYSLHIRIKDCEFKRCRKGLELINTKKLTCINSTFENNRYALWENHCSDFIIQNNTFIHPSGTDGAYSCKSLLYFVNPYSSEFGGFIITGNNFISPSGYGEGSCFCAQVDFPRGMLVKDNIFNIETSSPIFVAETRQNVPNKSLVFKGNTSISTNRPMILDGTYITSYYIGTGLGENYGSFN